MGETPDTFHIPEDKLQAFIDAAPDAATATIGADERYVSCKFCNLNIDAFISPGPGKPKRVMGLGEVRCPGRPNEGHCGNTDLNVGPSPEVIEACRPRDANDRSQGYALAVGEYVPPRAEEMPTIIQEAMRFAGTAFTGQMNYEDLELRDQVIVAAILAGAIYLGKAQQPPEQPQEEPTPFTVDCHHLERDSHKLLCHGPAFARLTVVSILACYECKHYLPVR